MENTPSRGISNLSVPIGTDEEENRMKETSIMLRKRKENYGSENLSNTETLSFEIQSKDDDKHFSAFQVAISAVVITLIACGVLFLIFDFQAVKQLFTIFTD